MVFDLPIESCDKQHTRAGVTRVRIKLEINVASTPKTRERMFTTMKVPARAPHGP